MPSLLYVQTFGVGDNETAFAHLEKFMQKEKFVPRYLSHTILGVLNLNLELSCFPQSLSHHFYILR